MTGSGAATRDCSAVKGRSPSTLPWTSVGSIRRPRRFPIEDAAAVALVGITAHLGLFRDAQLKVGENVFVNGGTRRRRPCVIQMARAVGARVLTTAGSDEKVRICRELGANLAVNYKTDDVDAALGKFGPIDVWFETLRQQDFDRIINHLAIRGRIIVMAGRDARPPFPVGPFYVKDCKLFGFAMFNATADEQRKCAGGDQSLAGEGEVAAADRPGDAAVAKRPPPTVFRKTTRPRRAGTLAGKIVLTP